MADLTIRASPLSIAATLNAIQPERPGFISIRVNAIAPGLVDTASNIAAMKPKDLKRWTKRKDIAETVLFLASPAAAGLTVARQQFLGPAKGPSITVRRLSPENLTRAPLELRCSPLPSSITPAFTISSLNFAIAESSSSEEHFAGLRILAP